MEAAIHVSLIAYSWLLYLYPRDFRSEFGAEMLEVFGEDVRDSWNSRHAAGLIEAWQFALRELITVALPLQLRSNLVVASVVSLLGTTLLYGMLFLAFNDKSHVRLSVPPWRH